MASRFSVEIARVPDRGHPVAGFWFGHDQVAGPRRDSGVATTEIHPRRNGSPWWLDHAGLPEVLGRPRARLFDDTEV